jgi:hypothetical protein
MSEPVYLDPIAVVEGPKPRDDVQHEVIPTTVLRRLEAFAKCAVCGRMATRINKSGKVAGWRHVDG